MKLKSAIFLFIFLTLCLFAKTQTCTTIGQTPSTAFPVCGTTTFKQSTVPLCNSNSLYVPGCSGSGNADYANKNPFWYKFTCYTSGTLGFLITPNNLADDYDWQLYDVTGHNPDEIYTNDHIIVTGNWAGNPGTTGASKDGANFIQCASSYDGSEPRFSKMPNLIAGHQYILLVSHFTDTQSGYSLSFGDGTAVITDTTKPALKELNSSCSATHLFVRLNKHMQCKSLAADGSDFTLSPGTIKIISAKAVCTGFDMDSLLLELSGPLPVGKYSLSVKEGTDGNTLLDNCDNPIPVGSSLPLVIEPLAPTPMDSLSPLQCAPQSLQLVFKKNILCSTVAPDGSDFAVSGPSAVNITGATTNCTDDLTQTITINLSAPIQKGGVYQIELKTGTDGNTILDECSQQTPIGSMIRFVVKDTVSADFTYHVAAGCKMDTVQFLHNGRNGVDQWNWQLDYNGKSNLQNPVTYFMPNGQKTIQLAVSNGFCNDSATKIISLGNELKAAFETNNTICPEDTAVFQNQSIGDIVSYYWDFKNGTISTDQNPLPQKYPVTQMESIYPVTLIVKNDIGCYDTAVNNIRVLKSCYIAVPNAFTPNGDGLNDYLYPLNAFKADHLEFKVYNRLGQLLFTSNDWSQEWDGTFKGEPQAAGVFVWTLKYSLRDTGKQFFKKGSTVLIR
jgi:gliding motility-associated-like protein